MKGVIVSIENKTAVILTKDGMFHNVRNHNYAVGQKISFHNRSTASLVSLAACLLLVFASFAVYRYPVSSVSVDINPSIELDVNWFGTVIQIIPVNIDAQNIIPKIKKDNVKNVVKNIIESSYQEGYLKDGNPIVVTALHPSQKTKEELNTMQLELPCPYYYQEGNQNDVTAARKYGISFGKACLIRNDSEKKGEDPSRMIQQWKDRTINELIPNDNKKDTDSSRNKKNNVKDPSCSLDNEDEDDTPQKDKNIDEDIDDKHESTSAEHKKKEVKDKNPSKPEEPQKEKFKKDDKKDEQDDDDEEDDRDIPESDEDN